ncbi:hypothetical protein ABC382_00005, partial [Lysinibacillus sp. 1P01SD]
MKNKKTKTGKKRKSNTASKVVKGVMAGVITMSAIAPTMAVNVKAMEEVSVFSGGEGTKESPYIITDSAQLAKIIDFPTSHFILDADINFSRMPLLNPIGNFNNPFKGVFDGNGHSISNYTLTSNAEGTSTGLFNVIDGATIKNLTIEDAVVSNSRSKMGVLVGLAKNPTIQNIKVKNSHVSALANTWSQTTGLLVGSLEGTDNGTTVIKNIDVEGNIDGYGYIGGLIGKISGSFKEANIMNIDANAILNGQGMEDNVGGLIGLVDALNTKISNIKVDGKVIGSEAVGGLIGQVTGVANNSVIKNVFTKPIIKGSTDANSNIYLGGLIGTDGGGIREGITIASPSIENPTASPNAHVVFGNAFTSNHLYYDTKYLKTIDLKGVTSEKSGITFATFTEAQKLQQQTYKDFDFGTIWGMYEGKSEPFLLFSMTDEERAEWEIENPPVDIYKDARLAVENAEKTQLQEDINTAQGLVTKLPTGEEKTNLQNRLNIVQDAINKAKAIVEATSAVESAESSQTREDFNSAQELVNALPSSEEKTELEKRLNELLSIIEEIETDADALKEATKAVDKANSTRYQSDIDIAQELITALKPSEEKDALQERLDDLIERIYLYEVMNAMQAVEEAEKSKLKDDIDKAQELVTALKPSEHKVELQERIDTLVQSIENENADKQALAKATQAVEEAETTRLQADVDTAQDLVTALKSSEEKEALQIRLDTLVQSMEDENADKEALAQTTQAVEEAETTRLQVDIDKAQELVTALKPSEEKEALQTRLDSLKQAIEMGDKESLTQATQAVEEAEISRLQADVDKAKNLVTALKPSEEKEALQVRLDALQQSIEDEIEVNKEAEAKASQAVEEAEISRLQADIDKAQSLVIALKPSEEKEILQIRLEALRQSIAEEKEAYEEALLKGTKAVQKAETTHLQSDVDLAQKLLDQLKVSAEKDALQTRLNVVQEIINQDIADQQALSKATDAVEKAEITRLLTDINTAKVLVEALKPSEEKNALHSRLDALSKSIDEEIKNEDALTKATKAVEDAEISRLKIDIETAQNLVTALKSSEEKTALQSRLDTLLQSIKEENEHVEALASATTAVEKAEETRKLEDLDKAQNLVTVLMQSTEKTTLQARLDALRYSIEAENTENEALAKATQGVVIAESTRLKANIDTAQKLVDALNSTSAKDALLARLDALKKSISDEKEAEIEAFTKATQAVENAEKTRLESDINKAKSLVDKLPASDSKANLKSRLDAIQATNEKEDSYKEALVQATKAVEKAESSLSQSDIDVAQRKVTALSYSAEKVILQSRLEALQNYVNKQNTGDQGLAKATQSVVKAESTRLQADINTARELVFKMPNSIEKNVLKGRLDSLQKSIDKEKQDKEALVKATQAVEKAESSKLQNDITKAQSLVAEMSGSEEKFKLQQRIDAISLVI